MAEFIALESARFHMRLDAASPSDDELTGLLKSAQGMLEGYFTYPIVERWPVAADVPPEIARAVMMIALNILDNPAEPITNIGAIRQMVGKYRRETF